MTLSVSKATLAAALLAAFLPLIGQEPAKVPPAVPAAEARPPAVKPKAAAPKTAKKPAGKVDPAAKAMFGAPNPKAPLVPTPSTKVPLPSKKKPAKIPYEKRMNLNGASREELMTLPTVDAATADKIIAGRPYKVSAELLTRNIIPGAHFWTLKPKVTAGKVAVPAKK